MWRRRSARRTSACASTVRDGAVDVHAGTQSTGQGHETTFAQVLADRFGIAPQLIRLTTGDTDALPSGGGSHSDRSMRLAGALLMETSGQIVAQARKVFAALAAADEADVTFEDGTFGAPRSNLRLGLFDIARAIETDPNVPPELRKPLTAEATFTGRMPAHPTGCAVCEVEVDPETGAIEVTRYASVDDAGQPINPLVLHGQVHGGIVQGLGQALMRDRRLRRRRPGAERELHGLRDAARRQRAEFRRGADRRPDRRQCAAREGRRRSRHHARARGGDQCGGRMRCRNTASTHIEMPATPAQGVLRQRYSGTTAVASTSILAAFSTSPATCTTAIAG